MNTIDEERKATMRACLQGLMANWNAFSPMMLQEPRIRAMVAIAEAAAELAHPYPRVKEDSDAAV